MINGMVFSVFSKVYESFFNARNESRMKLLKITSAERARRELE